MSMPPGVYFLSGNDAVAEGAIIAGCRFFAGYPITPSSEIAERLAARLPQVGGIFVQMEDEIASIMSIIGASWGGFKAMTATSGPGFSLMQESIGFAAITETPIVIVDVQRAGPSTGMPTYVGQGDVMQAKWGSHGPYEIIALSPSTVQECFNFIIDAFNLAEKYRVPVVLLMDERLSHLYEKIIIPDPKEILIINRKKPKTKENFLPYRADEDLVPPMPPVGEGYNFHVTGLTHDEKGYPNMSPEVQEKLVRRLCDKIRKNADKIASVETYNMDDADIAILTFGSVVRPALRAIKMAKNSGIKLGLIKLNTIWPFPEKIIQKIAESLKAIIVAEVNYGQVYHLVREAVAGATNVILLPKMGGTIHAAEELLNVALGVK